MAAGMSVIDGIGCGSFVQFISMCNGLDDSADDE